MNRSSTASEAAGTITATAGQERCTTVEQIYKRIGAEPSPGGRTRTETGPAEEEDRSAAVEEGRWAETADPDRQDHPAREVAHKEHSGVTCRSKGKRILEKHCGTKIKKQKNGRKVTTKPRCDISTQVKMKVRHKGKTWSRTWTVQTVPALCAAWGDICGSWPVPVCSALANRTVPPCSNGSTVGQ